MINELLVTVLDSSLFLQVSGGAALFLLSSGGLLVKSILNDGKKLIKND